MPRSKVPAQKIRPADISIPGTAKKSVNRINIDDLLSDAGSVSTPKLVSSQSHTGSVNTPIFIPSQSSEASAQRPPTPKVVPKPPGSKLKPQSASSNSKKTDRRKSLKTKSTPGNRVFKSSRVSKAVSEPPEYCIPKAAFQRLLKGITLDLKPGFRMKPETLNALQTATEHFIVGYFEDAVICASHAKRKTVMAKDMEMVARLRKIEYKEL